MRRSVLRGRLGGKHRSIKQLGIVAVPANPSMSKGVYRTAKGQMYIIEPNTLSPRQFHLVLEGLLHPNFITASHDVLAVLPPIGMNKRYNYVKELNVHGSRKPVNVRVLNVELDPHMLPRVVESPPEGAQRMMEATIGHKIGATQGVVEIIQPDDVMAIRRNMVYEGLERHLKLK